MSRMQYPLLKLTFFLPLPVLKFELAIANSSVDSLTVQGLTQTVEIIKDRWVISHIYAQNQAALFFAQEFNAARDRLFQLEMWRRRALGLLAEIQSKKALKHDIGARLLRGAV